VISNRTIPIQNQRPHIPNVDIFNNEFIIGLGLASRLGLATGLEVASRLGLASGLEVATRLATGLEGLSRKFTSFVADI
jgi:hypothetical protein